MSGAADHDRSARLFARPCSLVTSAASPDGFPPESFPEVAVAGRSNVGKSSLLNALTGRRSLARTSRQPGRTQTINFFAVAEALSLVDLPGYGFAQAPRDRVEAWGRLIETYLQQRANLRRVLLLIDARRGLMPIDRDAMEGLGVLGLSFQVVLTKIDALKQAEGEERLRETVDALRKYPAAFDQVIATSSRKMRGIDALRTAIADLAEP